VSIEKIKGDKFGQESDGKLRVDLNDRVSFWLEF
jgi:hypothetical protein